MMHLLIGSTLYLSSFRELMICDSETKGDLDLSTTYDKLFKPTLYPFKAYFASGWDSIKNISITSGIEMHLLEGPDKGLLLNIIMMEYWRGKKKFQLLARFKPKTFRLAGLSIHEPPLLTT